MSKKVLSNSLKVLILIIMICSLFGIFYILPRIGKELAREWEEIAYAYSTMLILSESLVAIFIIGLANIIFMLRLFDKNEAYSKIFIKGLNFLAFLCVVASLIIIVMFGYLKTIGGPGPLLGVILMTTILLILVLANVLLLIKAIIKDTIKYKEDSELTI